ncbi:MAG: DUF1854 domain-containing protein [Candidatus Brocadiaceae bacterium]|nr:DUF1854 domain-containing protein [Candidatus Brocadiaceae bacterium]
MAEPNAPQPEVPDRPGLGVRWLQPETTHVFSGTFSLLHCTVESEGIYRAVFAVMLFPISYPDRFISLRYTDSEDKVREIGVIDRLRDFPAEAQALLHESLQRQTHEKVIERIHEVREEKGMLFFHVKTQDGWERFVMPWRGDRAEDYSEGGKLLLDAYDNRYVIPDLAALTTAERRQLTAYVYW